MRPEEVRSAAGRGYGRAWQKARKAYLQKHPLCVECMKERRYVKASLRLKRSKYYEDTCAERKSPV